MAESQRQRLGLFQSLDEARDCDLAPAWALRQIGEIYGWFKANLAVPGQFSRGGWKGRGQPGLSWFKPVATEHIKQMHQLTMLAESGYRWTLLCWSPARASGAAVLRESRGRVGKFRIDAGTGSSSAALLQ